MEITEIDIADLLKLTAFIKADVLKAAASGKNDLDKIRKTREELEKLKKILSVKVKI